jgi:hypothetical protein
MEDARWMWTGAILVPRESSLVPRQASVCSLAIEGLIAQNSHLMNNSSPKEAFLPQNLHYCMPIS